MKARPPSRFDTVFGLLCDRWAIYPKTIVGYLNDPGRRVAQSTYRGAGSLDAQREGILMKLV